MAAIPLKHDDIYYPESDGQPMAETDLHREVMIDLIHGLQNYYADAPDVYVSGNLFVYETQGDPRSSFSPDTFVVQGVSKDWRSTFKLWEEGNVPCFIVEVTSKNTRREDLAKKDRYQRLGVEEYFLFDPLGDYLCPRLQGYRLAGGRYQPIESAPDGSLLSQITGLTLQVEGKRLRLIDTATGEKLLWDDEREAAKKREAEARRAAEERADREAEARRAAEEKAAREQERAEREEQARRALEEELARLRREMQRLDMDSEKDV